MPIEAFLLALVFAILMFALPTFSLLRPRSLMCRRRASFATCAQVTDTPPGEDIVGHFMNKKVLMVGEGDMGFCRALLELKSNARVTATTWDDKMRLFSSFPSAEENVNSIIDKGGEVLYNVDATKLEEVAQLQPESFDVICWNFPHVPGKQNIRRNRLLLRDFFESARSFLRKDKDACIKVTLCGNQSGTTVNGTSEWLQSWKLTDQAASTGLLLTDRTEFDLTPEFEKFYFPLGHRGHGGYFSAYQDNAHIFTLTDPTINKEARAVYAPLYSHEVHLNGPLTSDIIALETAAMREIREIAHEENVLYPDAVWAVHLVDLYLCPRTKALSHVLEVSYCALHCALDRDQADILRQAVEDRLPTRITSSSDVSFVGEGPYYLRKEKAGGRVSKPHSFLVAKAIKSLHKDIDSERYQAIQDRLSELLQHVGDMDGDDGEKLTDKRLTLVQKLARTLWKRRMGVIVNQIDEHADDPSTDAGALTSDMTDLQQEETRDYMVYVLKNSANKRTYLGITNNPERRLRQHNGKIKGGARYTSSFRGAGEWQYALQIKNLTKRESLSIERSAKNSNNFSRKDALERRFSVLLPLLGKFPKGNVIMMEPVVE